MKRGLFNFAAIVCMTVFSLIPLLTFRQYYVKDEFTLLYWNPATLKVDDVSLSSWGGAIGFHAEFAQALLTDTPAITKSWPVPSNFSFRHQSLSARLPLLGTPASPILWADHFLATPSRPINQNSVASNWTLQFRTPIAMIPFAILPTIWLLRRIRRKVDCRGFTLETEKPLDATQNAT